MRASILLVGALFSLLPGLAGTTAEAATPPPLECIGNSDENINAGTCVGPVWTDIEFDCITGDHYDRLGAANCGLPGFDPPLPGDRCDQPDVLLEGHRFSLDLHPLGIEGHGHERAAPHKEEIAGRRIARHPSVAE